MLAASAASIPCVKLLLDGGAPAAHAAGNGATALHAAAAQEDVSAARTLCNMLLEVRGMPGGGWGGV